MTAHYTPEPSARADTDEMRAAMFLASAKNVDYCDALDEVRRQYAAEQWPQSSDEVTEAFRFKYL